MKTGQIGKTIKDMKELRDTHVIDEEINEQLETLQNKLYNQCTVQCVLRRMNSEEMDAVMEEVIW